MANLESQEECLEPDFNGLLIHNSPSGGAQHLDGLAWLSYGERDNGDNVHNTKHYTTSPSSVETLRSQSKSSEAITETIYSSSNSDFDSPVLPDWLVNGQLVAPASKLDPSSISSRSRNDMSHANSTLLSPELPVVDSKCESSCGRCQMTDLEARKNRSERRREQNRASQRNFRARKEAKIREATCQVAHPEAYVEFLEMQNGELRDTTLSVTEQMDELRRKCLSIIGMEPHLYNDTGHRYE